MGSDIKNTARRRATKQKKAGSYSLTLIPTIYPKGYKEWLLVIKHFNKVHNLLPSYLQSFNDLDGWLNCYHLNCLDSEAFDIVCGYKAIPKRKKLKNRFVEFEREVYRFMALHHLGGEQYEKESEHGLNAMYSFKLTPLQAVDVLLGLRTLGDESA